MSEGYCQAIEAFREECFCIEEGTVHLDHAGSTIYSSLCIQRMMEKLFFRKGSQLLANPHSDGSFSSSNTNHQIDDIRQFILKEVFNTSLREYDLVFTFNATHSLKIISDCFPIGPHSSVGYLQYSHNSMIGALRSCAHGEENIKVYKTLTEFKQDIPNSFSHPNDRHIFGFSAECNGTGTKFTDFSIFSFLNQYHPNVFTILDSSKHSSTNVSIDLSKFKPDFVTLSFYKWFGYPTGLGALLIRKTRLSDVNFIPRNGYFAGGTIKVNTASKPFYFQYRNGFHSVLESGTIPFITIIELFSYLKELQQVFSGYLNMSDISFRDVFMTIQGHTSYLQRYAMQQLKKLVHFNDNPLVRIYNEDTIGNSSIITFNVFNSSGTMIGYSQIQQLCSLHGFNIRSGCFCVPGGKSFLLMPFYY